MAETFVHEGITFLVDLGTGTVAYKIGDRTELAEGAVVADVLTAYRARMEQQKTERRQPPYLHVVAGGMTVEKHGDLT